MGQTQTVAATRTTSGRRRRDLLLLLAGVAVLALSAVPIHADSVTDLEADTFRVINDLPGVIYNATWALMQLGNFVIVPVAAVIALAFRRFRLAAGLAVAGVVVWVLAKVIKDLIERGRPAQLLDDVVLRNSPAVGHGYISGHAAVAVALATVLTPYLSRWLQIVVWFLAAFVCLARVYVGAHLPLDVIGGAGFGLAVGSLVNLFLGRLDRAPAPASEQAAA